MLRYAVTLYLFLAVVITLYISAYMLSKGKATYMKAFSALSFCICIYLFGYLLELNSNTFEQMVFWNQVQYFGLAFFPALWLTVSLFYTKHVRFINLRTLAALFVIPVLTFVLRATNQHHHLYYSAMELREISGYAMLYLGKGPWYYVQSAYLLISVTLTSLLFYHEYRKSRDMERARYLFLLAASVLPHVGLIIILLNVLWAGLDYGALLMPVSSALVMFAILKYDFLEVKSLARENIFETSPDAMLLLDNGSRIVDYNQAALGLPFLNGPFDHRKLEDILGDTPDLLGVFKSATPQVFQIDLGGREKHFEVSSSSMYTAYGSLVGVLKSIRDITEMKTLEQQLRTAATIDELSELNNRRHFMELAEREFERSRRYDTDVSAVMLDVDNFKAINDTYGHACGDAVIRVIGKLLTSVFRKTDILGRIGGEEFAVILPNTAVEAAELAVERLQQVIAETEVFCGSARIKFTISSGVACFSQEVDGLDELLRRADEAMYASKASGGNRISIRFPHD